MTQNMFPRLRAKRPACAEHIPVEVVDEAELAELCALTDFDAAVHALWAECPQGLGLPPLALHAQLYTLLPNRTAVDRSIEDARTDARLTTLHVRALGEDAFVETARFAAELARAAADAASAPAAGSARDAGAQSASAASRTARTFATAARVLVGRCRDAVRGPDLIAAFGEDGAEASAAELAAAGFLVRRENVPADAREWAWALPALGGLASELGAARRAAVAILSKRAFHELPAAELRASLIAAGEGAGVRKRRALGRGRTLDRHGAVGLAERALGWTFVERYLCGTGIVHKKAVGLGSVLYLADADAARRRAAPPRPREC